MKTKKITEGTIAHSTVELIRAGFGNAEILEKIKQKHAGCQTSTACVSWYRTRVRKGLYGDKVGAIPTSLVAKIVAEQKRAELKK